MNNYEIKGVLQMIEDGDWLAFMLWPSFVLYLTQKYSTDEMAPAKPKKWLTAKIIQRIMRLQQLQRCKENWCQLSLHRTQWEGIKCLVFKMSGFKTWDHSLSGHADVQDYAEVTWLILCLCLILWNLFWSTLYHFYTEGRKLTFCRRLMN